MPTRLPRLCRCGRINIGRCPACQRQRDERRPNASLRTLYHSERWRRLRRAILDEQPACYDCWARGRLEPATDVHHKVKPTNALDFFDAARLGALCHSCHSMRTARGE